MIELAGDVLTYLRFLPFVFQVSEPEKFGSTWSGANINISLDNLGNKHQKSSAPTMKQLQQQNPTMPARGLRLLRSTEVERILWNRYPMCCLVFLAPTSLCAATCIAVSCRNSWSGTLIIILECWCCTLSSVSRALAADLQFPIVLWQFMLHLNTSLESWGCILSSFLRLHFNINLEGFGCRLPSLLRVCDCSSPLVCEGLRLSLAIILVSPEYYFSQCLTVISLPLVRLGRSQSSLALKKNGRRII